MKKIFICFLLIVFSFFSGYFIGKYKPEWIISNKNKSVNTKKKLKYHKKIKKKKTKKNITKKTKKIKRKNNDDDIIKDVIKQIK